MVVSRVKSNGELSALLEQGGKVRTDLDCHGCTEAGISPNTFVATINHDLNGNHKIECPRCGHIHYRVIQDGVATSERYNSGYPTHQVARRSVWKSNAVPIESSVTSSFIRDRWLNRD